MAIAYPSTEELIEIIKGSVLNAMATKYATNEIIASDNLGKFTG
jgi:hypothetical protein